MLLLPRKKTKAVLLILQFLSNLTSSDKVTVNPTRDICWSCDLLLDRKSKGVDATPRPSLSRFVLFSSLPLDSYVILEFNFLFASISTYSCADTAFARLKMTFNPHIPNKVVTKNMMKSMESGSAISVRWMSHSWIAIYYYATDAQELFVIAALPYRMKVAMKGKRLQGNLLQMMTNGNVWCAHQRRFF